ncbi:TPA: hypothetical protein DDW35_05655 [Candidatus Sumerlaeota bacterium]|jgi:hypothetical protein|nr:hypothetical protein [Candidatus Sumerlaeota bacterium]
MIQIKAVKQQEQNNLEIFTVEVVRGTQPALIILSNAQFEPLQFEGIDIFAAVQGVRRFLEAKGLLLTCNASRIDAYPSGMSRQMSAGRKLYVHELGVPGRPKTIVDIFDEAPIDKIGTIAEQDEYMQKWYASIGNNHDISK